MKKLQWCAGIILGFSIIAALLITSFEIAMYSDFSVYQEEYEKYVENADVIISHAGTGSVIPPLKKGKKVIVFPRMECYGEHLDDHQLELADIFTQNGYTLCATNKEELFNCLSNINGFVPKHFKSNSLNMNKLIIDFIEKNFSLR